jgi:hypothetical protein
VILDLVRPRAWAAVAVAIVLFAIAADARAQVTVVATSVGSLSSSAVSSVAIPVPAGVASGDLMLAMIAQRGGDSPKTRTAPAGWTPVVAPADGDSLGFDIYRRIAGSAEPATYTWALRGTDRTAATMVVLRGVDGTTPIDAVASQAVQPADASAIVTAPSVTTKVANTLLVAFWSAADGRAGFTPPGGMTEQFDNGNTSAGPNGLAISIATESRAATGATGARSATASQADANAGVLLAVRPGTASAASYRLSYAASGIYCLDHTVTLQVRDGAGNPVTTYAGTTQLTTTTGRGTWLLQSGGGTLVDSVPDDGAAAYTWKSGESSVTFSLRYRGGPSTVAVDAVDGTTASLQDDGTQGTIAFAPSGFTVTSSAYAPPASIPAFASQVAGTAFTLYLTAYGQTPTDATCGVIANYAGTKSLKFWQDHSNPATGSIAALVGGSAIGIGEASAVARSVTFTNGQASVAARYDDVGAVQLSMKDDTAASAIRGSTGAFVVRPYGFTVTNVRRTSDGVANPGTTTASGTVFLAAGRPFTATVTAVNALGTATPNFGRESTPESVRFTTQLVLPASGNAPAVTGSFGAFASGSATGTAFAWNEVGTMRLVPRIADGDYLAAGDVVGTATSPVGRFVPDRFDVATNTPLFQTGCAAGGFTYVGQPFTYSVAPVITATAVALGGTTTTNYTGSLFRMTSASIGVPVYAAPGYTLDTSGLPAAGTDPAIVDAGGGVARLTYSAGAGLALARTTPVAPFVPAIILSEDVVDLDGVRAASTVVFGASGGMLFTSGGTHRYGRVAVRGAAGSELLDLPVRTVVQHWLDAARGFTTASDDQCTVAPSITLRDWKRNLASGETCVRDTGSPGTSGAGCPAAAVVSKRYRGTASAGDFNLVLAAPGAGNSGAVTVEAVAPAWLKYDWNVATPGLENPSALATFGVFQGSSQRVYEREVY